MDATSDPGVRAFTNDAGEQVAVHAWLPAGPARAAVVIAHGIAEHGARYARFAQALTAQGYAVYAPDHRAHGRTAGAPERIGHAGPDGWNGIVRDLERLLALVGAAHPGVPRVLFGHSMGSVLAQRVAQLRGRELAGLILSGTTGATPNLAAALAAAQVLALGPGARRPSPLLRKTFADFNAPFGPGPTGFEWLSRDPAEVRKYADDPACGAAFSNGFLRDMLRGYAQAWQPRNEAQLPAELPVLLFAGERDPVGRFGAGVRALAERYRALGLRDVTVTLYAGGRHELLNDVDRDAVTRDVLGWLGERAGVPVA